MCPHNTTDINVQKSYINPILLFFNYFLLSIGELFLSLVLSRRSHARVLSVDPSAALKMEEVHGYIDHTDIPGTNLWGGVKKTEEIFASKEVGIVSFVIHWLMGVRDVYFPLHHMNWFNKIESDFFSGLKISLVVF